MLELELEEDEADFLQDMLQGGLGPLHAAPTPSHAWQQNANVTVQQASTAWPSGADTWLQYQYQPSSQALAVTQGAASSPPPTSQATAAAQQRHGASSSALPPRPTAILPSAVTSTAMNSLHQGLTSSHATQRAQRSDSTPVPCCDDSSSCSEVTSTPRPEQQCRECNDAAMRCLDRGQPARAFELLQQAMQHAQHIPEQHQHRHATLHLPQLQTTSHSATDRPQGAKATSGSDHWLAVTYNNLACYYQRQGKPQAALHYLNQAADLEKGARGSQPAGTGEPAPSSGAGYGAGVDDGSLVAGATEARTRHGVTEGTSVSGGAAGADAHASTLLNLSTVLSGMGRYEAALGHVDEALQLLCHALMADGQGTGAAATAAADCQLEKAGWEDMVAAGVQGRAVSPRLLVSALARHRPALPGAGALQVAKPSKVANAAATSNGLAGCGGSGEEAQWVWGVLTAAPTARASLCCMCLYNRGVVLEHLQQDSEALRAYRAASNAASALLGHGSSLVGTFGKALQAFKQRLQSQRRSSTKSRSQANASSAATRTTNSSQAGPGTRPGSVAGSAPQRPPMGRQGSELSGSEVSAVTSATTTSYTTTSSTARGSRSSAVSTSAPSRTSAGAAYLGSYQAAGRGRANSLTAASVPATGVAAVARPGTRVAGRARLGSAEAQRGGHHGDAARSGNQGGEPRGGAITSSPGSLQGAGSVVSLSSSDRASAPAAAGARRTPYLSSPPPAAPHTRVQSAARRSPPGVTSSLQTLPNVAMQSAVEGSTSGTVQRQLPCDGTQVDPPAAQGPTAAARAAAALAAEGELQVAVLPAGASKVEDWLRRHGALLPDPVAALGLAPLADQPGGTGTGQQVPGVQVAGGSPRDANAISGTGRANQVMPSTCDTDLVASDQVRVDADGTAAAAKPGRQADLVAPLSKAMAQSLAQAMAARSAELQQEVSARAPR